MSDYDKVMAVTVLALVLVNCGLAVMLMRSRRALARTAPLIHVADAIASDARQRARASHFTGQTR